VKSHVLLRTYSQCHWETQPQQQLVASGAETARHPQGKGRTLTTFLSQATPQRERDPAPACRACEC